MLPIPNDKKETFADADPTVPSTITFTSSNDHAILAINPSTNGTFGNTSGNDDIRFSLSTNNYSGYTLSVKATGTALNHTTDGTILSITSSVTATQFGASANTPLSNRWGYKPNYYNSEANTDRFYPATTSSVTLDHTTAANATAKSYTISLGARVDYTIPSGTYENSTFTLEYIANPVPYTITFNNNASDDIVTNMPASLTGSSSSPDTITLPSRIPQRTNYTFVGWCTVQPTEVAGGQSCSGTTYSTSAQYGMDYTANNSSNVLYAIWTSTRGCNKAATTIGTGVTATDAVCMQDINDTVIASMTQDVQHTLIDMRDGNSYFVAKLVDGKVWMTQNLNYHLNTTSTLTHHTTDLGYETDDETKTWTPSRGTLTSMENWADDASIPMSYDSSLWYYASSGSTSADTSSPICEDASTCAHFNAGTYYNWLAAIAENETSSNDFDAMPDSVCPAGWRLQDAYDGITYGELNYVFFQKGYVAKYVNSGNASLQSGALNSLRDAPLYIIRAARLTNGAISSNGTFANYWSRTAKNTTSSYAPYINNSTMYAMSSTTKSYGISVRCVARMTTGTTNITFHGNGSTSGVDFTITTESGRAVNLHYYGSFVKPGYVVSSWNTKADGTGNTYLETDTIFTPVTGNATVNLYAQWLPAYSISYDGNNATSTAPMPAYHVVKDGTAINLVPPNYKRNGYGFAGWSTTQINPDASDAATQMANAKIFGPNQTIVANSTNLGTSVPAVVTLYAVWVKSSGTLQTWNGCDSLTAATYSNGVITPGSVIALTDSRDNNVYAIAKLTDGNCWMMENLRLDSANSSDRTKAQGYGGTFVGLANSEDVFSGTQSNSIYTIDDFSSGMGEYRFPRYNNNNINFGGTNASNVPLSISYNGNSDHEQWFGYGNYYSFNAAKATTIHIDNANSDDPGTSICPRGWILPSSTTSYTQNLGFMKLNYSMGGTSARSYTSSTTPTGATLSNLWRTYPNNYVYAGEFVDSSTKNRGTYAYHWGSYNYSSTWGESMYFNATSWYIYTLEKFEGASVRCVKDSSFRVRYNGNGADNPNGMEAATHAAVESSSVTLYASNFKRDGYGFLGWSTTQIDPDAANYSTLLASLVSGGDIHGPNETITIPSSVPQDIIMYAVWIKSAGNLQNWSGCSSLASGGVTALKDTRDNQVYAVAKLADGNCWMIENLRLDHDNSYDSSKAQGFGGAFTGLAASESFFPDADYYSLSNSLYTTDTNSTDLNIIRGINLGYRIPRYGRVNTKNPTLTMANGNGNIYSYGNYYSFAAAIANTNDLTTQDSASLGTSICPAGWRLPTGGAAGREYAVLNTNVNSGSTTSSVGLRRYPNNFIFNGYHNSGIGNYESSRGSYGYYLSGSSVSASSAGYFYFYSSYVSPSSAASKNRGYSIRCIVASGTVLTLHSNDSTNRVQRIYTTSGSTITLSNTMFSKEGEKVSSWNTVANGSGTSYSTSITVSSNTTLYAQWNPTYNIVYDGNGAPATTLMNNTSNANVLDGEETALYGSNFVRSGYGFLGWSLTQIDPDAANASALISSTKIYGPSETIVANSSVFGQSAPATITLYAVWLKSSGTFQNWKGCSSLAQTTYGDGTITPGSVIALTDNRGSNDNTYAIARLPDGQCWMIEDLRLDIKNDNITAANTIGVTASFLSSRTGSSSTCSSNTKACTETISYSTSTAAPKGTYYNWYTVSAGNGSFTSTYSNDGSICPAGWHLPTGGAYYELGDFMVSIGGLKQNMSSATNPTGAVVSKRLRTYPLNFGYNGYSYSTYTYGLNTQGYYQVDNGFVSGSNTYGYFFNISDTNVIIGSGNTKYYRYRARCIYSPTIIYDGNGATSGSGSALTKMTGSTVFLNKTDYKRTGYGLVGWSLNANGTGTIYGINEEISVSAISSYADAVGNIKLYAVWVPVTGDIQNWDSCSSLTKPSVGVATSGLSNVTALTDTRDGNVYVVARLADGQCYFADDLMLGDATISVALDSTNTDTSSTVTAATFNAYRSTSYKSSTTVGYANVLRSYNLNNSMAYSFCAITLGEICASSVAANVNATQSICPAGWKLYDENTVGSLKSTGYNTVSLATKSPVNGGMGLTLVASASRGPYSSTYATSRTISTTNIHSFLINKTTLSESTSSGRGGGFGVRCRLIHRPINDLTYLQDFYSLTADELFETISTMLTGHVYELIDNRDNKIYGIAKLEDGNVWMVDNLDLGRTTLTTNLTSANTNIASTVPASTFNGWKKTTSSNSPTSGDFIPITTTNSANGLDTDPVSGTAYGTLYNFCAASAGTVCVNSASSNAVYDICPAGWRLPTGNTGGEFESLYSHYNSVDLTRNPIDSGGAAFGLVGLFTSSTPYSQGTSGFFWSSTIMSTTSAYRLGVGTSSVNPTNGGGRDYGAAIRCIVKQPMTIADVTYMQDLDGLSTFDLEGIAASMAENTVYTLIDNRDNTSYSVAKLKDGNIWMIDNLDLGRTTLTTNLTSANTNINSTITAATFNGWKTTTGPFVYNAGAYIPIDGTDSTSGAKYGTLYNFYATSGGAISTTSSYTNAINYDICPAGWRLPIGNKFGEFQNLYSLYGSSSTAMRNSVASGGAAFSLPGYFGNGAPSSKDTIAYYISSTNGYDAEWYAMYMSNGTTNAESSTARLNGASVRCVVKKLKTIDDINWMQAFYALSPEDKTSVIDSMQSNTVYSMSDIRDGQSYKVAKLADDGVYMIDNLNLGSSSSPINSYSLLHSNTNVSGNFAYTVSNFNNARKTANFSSLTEMGYINVSGTDSTSGTKFGTIYNYCAASVNEICTSNNSANATRDLCPAGWSLPTGGANSQFVSLYNAYGSYANMRKTVASGGAGLSYSGATTPYLGTNMLQSTIAYWSKTRYDGVAMNALDVYSGGSIGSNDFKDRNFGGYLRCRLK